MKYSSVDLEQISNNSVILINRLNCHHKYYKTKVNQTSALLKISFFSFLFYRYYEFVLKFPFDIIL